MSLKITILGCGNSAGVPAIGNHWGKCDPAEPKNRRTRPAIAVQSARTNLIVDTGPDFREQVNRENIVMPPDAVLYTHAHSDHLCGIDDLRALRLRLDKIIDIYAMPATMAEIELRFDYLFATKSSTYPLALHPHLITPEQYGRPLRIGDIDVVPFLQDHGTGETLGFRFGDVAYSTDMVRLGEAAVETLRGIKTWIVDAAGYHMESNRVHITLRDLYALNERIGAAQVFLTHMPPGMDYQTMLRELPAGYAPAYDGLVIGGADEGGDFAQRGA